MIKIPDEILLELAEQLARLKPRDTERRRLIERTAHLLACSPKTVYRQVAKFHGPKRCTRADKGLPRRRPEADFKRWVEIVAAIKLATRNKQGRHLSTSRAIELAEEGVYLEGRFEQIPRGVFRRTCCDEWMRRLGMGIISPGRRFCRRRDNRDCHNLGSSA